MKKILGIGLLGLAVSLSQSAMAISITGNIEFGAAGFFKSTVGGVAADVGGNTNGLLDACTNANGFGACGDGNYETGPVTGFDFIMPSSIITYGTGSLISDYGLLYQSVDLFDIDLDLGVPPLLEWSVVTGGGATPPIEGTMKFYITDGAETDIDNNSEGKWDLAGNGYFEFTCAGDAPVGCEDETVLGGWSISNGGGVIISANNYVPAPAGLGLLGLGLLGLGFARNRRNRAEAA